MISSEKKIGLLILTVLLLPVIVFSIFEIGNLRRNENVIWDIYRNQLNGILFSINQYSEEIISWQAGKIENVTNDEKNKIFTDNMQNEFSSMESAVQFDMDFNTILEFSKSKDTNTLYVLKQHLIKNDSLIFSLKKYLEGGYRKILPLKVKKIENQPLLFLTKDNGSYIINIMVIDPQKYISGLLDPKIQEIIREKFYVTAYKNSEIIYSSDKQHIPYKIIERTDFWLFPQYSMGIELMDRSIADLAKERMKRNLLVIGIVDVILLLSVILIFRNVKKQLELSQMKSDFVSNVSHEIRTPLALISMYIETLEMGRIKGQEKIKEYYSIILNETQRLSGMVNQILSFSQIESKKRKYFFSNIQINDIVENTINNFRFNLENKGFNLNVSIDGDLPPVKGDKDAIAEAFVNLFDNAIKYSNDKKEINVKTGKNHNFVFVEVEDKGVGISEKNQKYIFDKFFRVTEKNLANKVKGSGLGLSIVKHIMDAHKGKIEVKSEPENGSLFRLLFPYNSLK